MSNPDIDKSLPRSTSAASDVLIANSVALTGVILLLIAVALYAWLFYAVSLLPGDPVELRQLNPNTPAQIRLIILASAAGVLNIVALVLCTVGLLLPNRPRLLATIGAAASLALLVGVFGVLAVGVMLQKATEAEPESDVSIGFVAS